LPDAAKLASAFSRAVTRIGASGAGQLAKMVNQTAIAGLLQGLSEAIAFGQRAGLDMPLVSMVTTPPEMVIPPFVVLAVQRRVGVPSAAIWSSVKKLV
jgi:3-hydroxyisobutyrate dehydrogenase-like beta-hydroxyacid dehydrogenase